ncbi:phosphatase and actin regulator 2 isoform X6 [Rattus norvegicus]|uniref:Phosphatase and actin regulator n=1 Tax=Rattus norvegicus TaxID=10116 RepID=A0A8I5ZMK8_RAT|nr:phosphatase and actin regulator 2 isoform X8 [Rattus norvegicus]|eukprot:XP_017444591.1 PREDICTED: phosphatase and actin regulator 2 isoform X6 [Rattus norvegicus]
MAEAGRSPEMSPDQPDGQEAVAAEVPDPEPEAPGPPVPALRWLPGDPSPRGRSQSDLSSASSRGRPLRVHISGSVDGLDKASIANSDGPPAGSQTPPFKRKGKLSTIGKIFKPWKWRKKKTSDKFRETSAVLERKISTRQSREELIRRGLLKELPDQAGSSHPKKTTGSKASSSPSASSTSSHPRGPKESLTGKAGAVGTTRGKKKISKQPAAAASRLSPNTVTSETSSLKGELSDTGVESLKPEETVAGAEEEATGKPKAVVVALPPVTVPPSSPALPLPPEDPCTIALDTPMVLVSDGPTLPISALETSPLPGTEEPANRTTPYSSTGLGGSREQAKCFTTKDGPGKAGPQLLTPGQMGDSLESFSAPEDEAPREYQANDSDSDGPILYTDDDDEEDDDDDSTGESALASKIRRRDTLAIKLGNRPSKKELEDKNILQRTSEEERQELRQQIGTKLVRRLSQRPTTEELEQRNILKQKNEEEEQEAKMELKRRLSRKLSLRPTVAELQARRILRFNEYVEVTDSPDYDRRADKPWARLTPADKAAIRKELNEFKSTEMEVHEESRQFTRFHRP